MGRTSIEWTHYTWQPGIYGCEEVSPACAHCYAAKMAHRLTAMNVVGYATPEGGRPITEKRASGVHWSGVVRTSAEPRVDELPSQRSAQRLQQQGVRPRVFVTSMADVFHSAVPLTFIVDMFDAMADRPDVDFLVLTKRAEAMADFARGYRRWPAHVWAGVTAEDQRRYDERAPFLCRIAGPAVRFLSMEPLLSAVDLRLDRCSSCGGSGRLDPFNDCAECDGRGRYTLHPDRMRSYPNGIDWVIAGSESGTTQRTTELAWVRSLRDQCAAAGVPFFLKQLDVGDGLEGLPPLDGRTHRDVPGEVVDVG